MDLVSTGGKVGKYLFLAVPVVAIHQMLTQGLWAAFRALVILAGLGFICLCLSFWSFRRQINPGK